MAISSNTTTFGNLVPGPMQRPVTGQDPRLVGLAYPVPVDPKNGYFSKMSGLSLVKSNLRSILKTERGERFMRPDYGCNLRKFLMEPLDAVTFSLIKEEIVIAIRRYLSTVSLGKVQVFETVDSNLKVNLFCNYRNLTSTSFNVGVRI